jgi:phosphoglycolate phosphatase
MKEERLQVTKVQPLPKLVMFDLDGTLVDTVRTTSSVFSQIRSNRGYSPVEPDVLKPYISRGAEDLVAAALGEALVCRTRDLVEFRTLLAQAEANPDEIYDGVPDVLAALAEMAVPLAIVTNKPQSLAEKLLAELKLEVFFDLILGGDAVANKKPHRDHIDTALKHFGVAAHEAVMVGDSEIDQSAALASGVKFVLFRQGYGGSALMSCQQTTGVDEFKSVLDVLRG